MSLYKGFIPTWTRLVSAVCFKKYLCMNINYSISLYYFNGFLSLSYYIRVLEMECLLHTSFCNIYLFLDN